MEKQYAFFATEVHNKDVWYKTRVRHWGLWKYTAPDSNTNAQQAQAQGSTHYQYQTSSVPRTSGETMRCCTMPFEIIMMPPCRFGAGHSICLTTILTHPEEAAHRIAVKRTKRVWARGDEIYNCFRAAVMLLERPSQGNNGGKAGDFAQGVRLMRISFAELSQVLLDLEPPPLPLWLMYIMAMFRETSASDFRPMEAQLLRHLYELTTTGAASHPTVLLWRAFWSGSRNRGFASTNRHDLNKCAAIAVDIFSGTSATYTPGPST
ncbi:hypothetical protein B0H66DRAFT_623506 [Apodospora peruviana]|uniref:Uncharacterized protein n=1 Tax=Apodospora peruviana TaxID=516989 RepID=A0AAE0M4J9_9PEZI|nr:hypothetical protein B0H66DRAFT_623506 [Apodospora peruviana]